jgi:hypothetical protein
MVSISAGMKSSLDRCRLGTALMAGAAVLSITAGCGQSSDPPPPRFPNSNTVAAGPRSIGVPYGPIVLLRSGEQLVALRITSESQLGQVIEVEWFAPPVGGKDFTNAKHGGGTAREHRGIGYIAAGPLSLEWSRGSAEMGWIYWPDENTDLAACSRAWANLDEVDPDAPDIRWYTKEMFER